MDESNRSGQWQSSFGFIIACVGSAVGLGNLWKFPYITYENGGGAFVLVYLIAISMVGLPILVAEIMIGRHGRHNVFASYKILSGNKWFWKFVGIFSILTSIAVLSFYLVVAGWSLSYFFNSISGNLLSQTKETVDPYFGEFVGSGVKQILYHTLFTLLTVWIVIRGTSGIERAVKFLMPLLFLFVLIIMIISISNFGGKSAFDFLFSFDLSKITAHGALQAVGHAFFTLSIGMGIMIIYGSYLPNGKSIIRASLWAVFFDTLIAIMACFMMYPIIFGNNLNLSASTSMLFTTLTVQFNSLPGGQYISAIFYLLVAFAALSSTISMIEPLVSYVAEEYNVKRKKATFTGAFIVWGLGLFSALSLGANPVLTHFKFFDKIDFLASNWGLTLGGLFVATFAGYVLPKKVRLEELGLKDNSLFYKFWLFCVRFFAPLMIIFIMLSELGIL
ncbi:MAG: sodium-dependent transporter [Chitinophagales bacterium]|nr:sodium-dependent transporter [Chitinophagales bacterium]